MNILFVCTGNTCRSPMAERLLWSIAQQEGIAVSTRSAGISCAPGNGIAKHMATLLDRKGIPQHHISQMISDRLMEWADLILAMTFAHKQAIIQEYPYALKKIHLFKEYVEDEPHALSDFDILDPFGGSFAEYELCAEEIETQIRKLVSKLHYFKKV